MGLWDFSAASTSFLIRVTLNRQSWERESRPLNEGMLHMISPITHTHIFSCLLRSCRGVGIGFFLAFSWGMDCLKSLLCKLSNFWLSSNGQSEFNKSINASSSLDLGFVLLVEFKDIAAIRLAEVSTESCCSVLVSGILMVLSLTRVKGTLAVEPFASHCGMRDSSSFIHCDNQEYKA